MVENRRLSTLLCARGAQPQRPRRPQAAPLPAEVQRKTPRPLETNTLTQFVHPAESVQIKTKNRRAAAIFGKSQRLTAPALHSS